MNIDCPRREFHDAVSAATAASSVRTSVQILQNVKIEAHPQGIRVLGCDGEIWVERDIPCMVGTPGAICLQAKTLNDITSQLPDGDLQLASLDNGGVLLTRGQSEYRLQSLDAEDFPEPPQVSQTGELVLAMGLLREAVDSVSFAVSTDQHRQVLTGVLFSYDGETLTLVATDTHRLAVRRIQQAGLGSNVNAIVPEKALRAIKALPIQDDADVTIRFSEDRLSVEANGAKVVSQLLNGTYPNWERVVPGVTTRVWSVDAAQLLEKVKRAMILARDNANRVRFKGDGDQITIAARSEERGEAKEEVMMTADNGDIEIAFNGKYVQDMLSTVKGPGVRIEMSENKLPAVFRPAEESDSYFCVIMPMGLM